MKKRFASKRSRLNLRGLGATLMLVLFPIFGWAQASKAAEIEFGYVEQPPRTFTNAQGKADGQLIRLLSTVMKTAGLSWRATAYPANRLFSNLKDGSTQLSILVRVPALEECCIYSKQALGGDELRAYAIGNKPPITRKEDLIGKNIIVLRGYSYSGLINFINDPANKIKTEIAATHEPAFEMLTAGRADYVLDYGEASEKALAGVAPIPGLRHDVVDRVYRYLVITKSYPDAENTLKRIEAVLKTINVDEYLTTEKK